MFLFSKKFLPLLLVMALALEGEDHSAEGLALCWECNGDGDGIFSPGCDDKHDGSDAACETPNHACAMYMEKGTINKRCETNPSKWKDDSTGKPICIPNQECYCNDADRCNKDINFGFDEGTDKSGSFGTTGMFPARSTLFWMMATVVVALFPSICIPAK